MKTNISILQNIEDAARLLRDSARRLEDEGFLELDFEIRIRPQRPTATVTLNTEPGENIPPSK